MAQGNGIQQILELLRGVSARIDRLEQTDLRLEAKLDALREDFHQRLDNLVFTMGGRVRTIEDRLAKLETKGKRS
ncbi:MAG: hypothetical protein HYZ28_13020 [Myxococcales bacterium]|nr:hypothetical protein [Myxococcales bacterium]